MPRTTAEEEHADSFNDSDGVLETEEDESEADSGYGRTWGRDLLRIHAPSDHAVSLQISQNETQKGRLGQGPDCSQEGPRGRSSTGQEEG